MRRLILMLLLTALPTTMWAETVVYRDGKFLRLLRNGQTLKEYVINYYAGQVFNPPQGTYLVERADSARESKFMASADSVIVFDWRDVAGLLDTSYVETKEAAREISKTLKKGDSFVRRDSIKTEDGRVIKLKKDK